MEVTMNNKKQSSVEQVFSHIKASRNDIQYWNDSMLVDWLLEQEDRFKAMHKEEIVKAYNRDVINKKQNWFIENGERYYNLHYKEEQVGISDKENQLGKTNPDYKFEDGV